MTTANESTMRRIAIVLASLPGPVAQRLLGSLHRDSQSSIREALSSLSDVDPLERRRALDGFANSLRKGKVPNNNNDAAEIIFSKAAVRNLKDSSQETETSAQHGPSATTSGTGKPAAPLAFLLDVDDDAMVEHLSGEMPQTLAIILASISPAQAARVLPRLDINVRTEAMRRMANLKELPSELVEDIGNQLRRRLVPARGTTGAGRVALDAILAEMPHENAPREPQQRPTIAEQPTRVIGTNRSENVANDSSVVTRPAVKVADGTWPENAPSNSSHTAVALDEPIERPGVPSPLDSTDSIHSYLMALPVDRLRDALGSVAIRTALLTLCGLPNAKAEAVLASLPRRQAKQVREQLSQLGTLELREIDAAKEAVAQQVLGNRSDTGKLRITAVAA